MPYWVEEHSLECEHYIYSPDGEKVHFQHKRLFGPFRTFNEVEKYLGEQQAAPYNLYTVWEYE